MIGTRISRWTMSYFAAAVLWLLVALALMVLGVGYPSADLASPDTLVLVHAVCIGWLSLAMCGALFQFVPVLVVRPLYSETWALPALGLLTVGLLLLLAGFLALGGRLPAWLWLLPAGAILLVAGFSLAALDLALTAWVRPTGPARFVLAGLVALVATIAFGAVFAFALAGWAGSIGEVFLASAVPLHAIAGLGGWLMLTAMGVSYRLLSMFMLAPDVDERKSGMTLWAGTLAIAIAVGGGLAAMALAHGMNVVLVLAAVLGLAASALYGRDVVAIFRFRKRRRLELNARMAALSGASLAGTVVLGAVLIATERLAMHVGAFAFLAVFGWLSGLVLAKLYKIVAFLTWLEVYGPVMGRIPTPRVQDLVAERRASKWFAIYYAAVFAGTALLLLDLPLAFRAAAFAMATGTAGIVVELVRIRRLDEVAGPMQLPDETLAPHLLFARS